MNAINEGRKSIADAIRTRVMVSHALCAIAESETHAGETTKAQETVRAIRGIIRELGLDVEEQLPASAVRELIDFCYELEKGIGKIEAVMKPDS